MLIQGSFNGQKDNLLIDKYTSLIKSGAASEEILVLLLNPYKKALFSNAVKADKNSKIFTLNGLCYNSFVDNIDYIKTLIKSGEEELNLCGLEVSQYIFKQSIKKADFSDYISKVNLLHQLFRRYSLIVQNDLNNKEIEKRSKLLNESFYTDAQKAINDYKLKTIEYRSFDYLRQLAIFPLIYQNTPYFSKIKYLIADDADEMPYVFWKFIHHLMPQLKDYMIGYDKDGSTRCGYLCAYKSGVREFIKNFSPAINNIADKNPFYPLAQTFSENIKRGQKTKIDKIRYSSSVKRLDMINSAIDDIKKLLLSGVKPSEILIVSPLLDSVLEKSLEDIDAQIISGSEKLCDDKIIQYIIAILKIVNNLEIKEFERINLFTGLLNIPYKECFNKAEFENDKYIKFKSVINSLKQKTYSLVEQIKIIYTNLLSSMNDDDKKYDFLLKEAESFEKAFKKNITEDFILQIENSLISENPVNAFSIKNNKIFVSTPQKVIDYAIKTKYQFWLDVSNSEWFKQDTGTLYNAWVMNRDWEKDEYSIEDNITLTRDKTARIVRKLMLLCQKEIRFYSSLYDNSLNENFSGLTDFIEIAHEKKSEFNIIPREDQKPVLDYSKGRMGIMAVPGAGKTTILLALIIKMLKAGIEPANIFVLTYMESAAKNFKERIKQSLPDSVDTPNISTIHGLALRIIKENGNYTKAGLDENFEICDDSTRERILKELFFKLRIADDKYENYLRSISIVKLCENPSELKSKYADIQEFYNFLNEYNKSLKSQNLIDYDDMLRFAVKILKENKEIAQYYQSLCQFIIEDEAQDSTDIQQTLINLLSKKHKNVIRCGDINQSITSTFTDSNLEGFKNFIKQNKKVEMVSSQRCAKPIYTLANTMVKEAAETNAFYQIEMKGAGNNPKSETAPEFKTFESEREEKLFILNTIKEIRQKDENASIAILLRLNAQVNDFNSYLNENGLKTAIRTDCLEQKEIYKYIYSVLSIIQNPLNNKEIIPLANLYAIQSPESYFNELKTPFINLNPDEIENEKLMQLYWDIDYLLNCANKPLEQTALEIGLYYSKNAADKSNTFLVSSFIKRLKSENETDSELLKKLEYNAQRPLSAYKFFEEETTADNTLINIMTMHKSKGDEFDYVFIPQLNEENYPTDRSKVKLKAGAHFVQTIKSSVQNTKIKTPDELKTEQIQETLRLLYVGITRAKKQLYLTNANNYKTRKNTTHNIFIKNISQNSVQS